MLWEISKLKEIEFLLVSKTLKVDYTLDHTQVSWKIKSNSLVKITKFLKMLYNYGPLYTWDIVLKIEKLLFMLNNLKEHILKIFQFIILLPNIGDSI